MSLVTLVCVILFAGVICYLINIAPFIDPRFKQVAIWVIIVCIVLWIAYTLLGPLPNMRIPSRHG